MITRIQWLWINRKNLITMLAFRLLRRAMARDPMYATSWHCNIAMAIYDESRPRCICEILDGEFTGHRQTCAVVRAHNAGIHEPLSHEFCNNVAARFMKLCFGVNSTN